MSPTSEASASVCVIALFRSSASRSLCAPSACSFQRSRKRCASASARGNRFRLPVPRLPVPRRVHRGCMRWHTRGTPAPIPGTGCAANAVACVLIAGGGTLRTSRATCCLYRSIACSGGGCVSRSWHRTKKSKTPNTALAVQNALGLRALVFDFGGQQDRSRIGSLSAWQQHALKHTHPQAWHNLNGRENAVPCL
eukprot:3933172-Rhodomonas_salina.1